MFTFRKCSPVLGNTIRRSILRYNSHYSSFPLVLLRNAGYPHSYSAGHFATFRNQLFRFHQSISSHSHYQGQKVQSSIDLLLHLNILSL